MTELEKRIYEAISKGKGLKGSEIANIIDEDKKNEKRLEISNEYQEYKEYEKQLDVMMEDVMKQGVTYVWQMK